MAGEWARFRTTSTPSTPRYKAGDTYEHDGKTYKLDDRAAKGLNMGATLNQDHLNALEQVSGAPDTASQILAGNDAEKAQKQAQNTRSNLSAEANAQQQYDNAKTAAEANKATKDIAAKAAASNRQGNANSYEDAYNSMTPEQMKDPNNYRVLINAAKADELTPEQLNKAIEDYQSGKYVPGAAGKKWIEGEIAKREKAKNTMKDIGKNVGVQQTLANAGYDLDNSDKEPSPETADNIEENVSQDNGGENPLDKDPKAAVEDANKLGIWDKIAIGLTALSFVMAAVSGGAILPINLTAIGGTQDRIKALTQVRQDRDKFRTSIMNAQTAAADKERFFKENLNATEEDYKKYQKAAGEYTYNASEKSAQDDADLSTQERLMEITQQYGMDNKKLDHLQNMEVLDKQGNWNIAAIKANTEAQKEISKLLHQQDVNKAAAVYQSLKAAGLSKPEALQSLGITNDMQRYLNNANQVVGTAANAAGTVVQGLTSDKNKKSVKHEYIPANKRSK